MPETRKKLVDWSIDLKSAICDFDPWQELDDEDLARQVFWKVPCHSPNLKRSRASEFSLRIPILTLPTVSGSS
jgi:hypothetical protein